MGRWAQRDRRGGGGAGTADRVPTTQIAGAVHFLTHQVTLTYTNDVTATDFPATAFSLTPNGQTSTTVAQLSSNQLRITFGGANVVAGDVIHYGGGNPHAVAPDSFTVT